MTYNIYAWCQMIVLCSFIGYIVENVWLLFTKNYIDNRNMNLPFLLGYGLAILGVDLVLGTPEPSLNGILLYFIELVVAVSIGEILLGTAVEKLCGFIYWDYSRLPLHLTRYTSLFTSMGFALIIEIFMSNFFASAMDLINRLMSPGIEIVSVILAVILTFDFADSFIHMYKRRRQYKKWMLTIKDHRVELRIIDR